MRHRAITIGMVLNSIVLLLFHTAVLTAVFASERDADTAEPEAGLAAAGLADLQFEDLALTPAPTGLTAIVYSTSALEIFWDRVTTTPTSYDIYRNDVLIQRDTFATSLFETNLSAATSYSYQVVAIVNGVRSDPVSVVATTRDGYSFNTGTPAPTGGRAVAYSTNSLEIFWDRAQEPFTTYDVFRDGNLIRSRIFGLSVFDTMLIPDTLYEYSVVAYVDGVASEPLIIQVRTPQEPLDRPGPDPQPEPDSLVPSPSGGRSVTYSATTAEIFWDRAAEPLTTYDIYRNGIEIRSGIFGQSVFESRLLPATYYEYSVIAIIDGQMSEPLTIVLTTPGVSEQTDGGEPDDEATLPDSENDDLPGSESPARNAESMVTAFESFLTRNNINAGAIAVSYEGSLVSSAGVNREATSPVPVASLSKAITAVCTVKAMQFASADYDDTLEQLLIQFDQRQLDPEADLRKVTIGQLLAHNSGLQTPHLSVFGPTVTSLREEQKLSQFDFIVTDGLSAEPGSGHYYANSNYLLLGLVIEALTLDDYENWCFSNVLEPLAITSAALSEDWGFLSSYGGWEISAVDYLTFIDAYFQEETVAGENLDELPARVSVQGAIDYGLGSYMRDNGNGYLHWHFGSFFWNSATQSGKFGAFFAAYDNGLSVSVNVDSNFPENSASELDFILYQAAHAINNR